MTCSGFPGRRTTIDRRANTSLKNMKCGLGAIRRHDCSGAGLRAAEAAIHDRPHPRRPPTSPCRCSLSRLNYRYRRTSSTPSYWLRGGAAAEPAETAPRSSGDPHARGPGLVASAALLVAGMHWIIGWSWAAAGLFGAVISAPLRGAGSDCRQDRDHGRTLASVSKRPPDPRW